jgi:hypothetical protein
MVEVMSSGTPQPTIGLATALVVSIDQVRTQAILFDTVDGQGRFIGSASAPSTLLPPIDDVNVGLRHVLQRLDNDAGQTLLEGSSIMAPREADRGIDTAILTGQPVSPIRMSFITSGEHALGPVLLEVIRSTPTFVQAISSRGQGEDGALSGSALEAALQEFGPEVILLLAGNDVGLGWPTIVGTVAGLVRDGAVEQVIVLAPETLQQQLTHHLDDTSNLTGLDPDQHDASEVAEAIEVELNAISENRVSALDLSALPSTTRFVTTSRAGDLSARFLAYWRNEDVLVAGIDDGARVHWASPSTNAQVFRPDLDLRFNIRGLLTLDPASIARWLPFSMSVEDIRHWILNRALRPHATVTGLRNQLIESAAATALLRELASQLPGGVRNVDLLIGGPLFSSWETPTLGVVSLLNGLAPRSESGLIQVILDHDNILLAAGALGEVSPATAADAVELDLITPTASVIVVHGDGQDGELAVRGEIDYGSGVESFAIPFGCIHRLTLEEDQSAVVRLNCEPSFSIGADPDNTAVTFDERSRLRGGVAGLLIDARGVQRQAALDTAVSTNRVGQWYRDLGINLDLDRQSSF